jgi:endonuclease/exonuclease/phosphatase family metal-dependent hydrolase
MVKIVGFVVSLVAALVIAPVGAATEAEERQRARGKVSAAAAGLHVATYNICRPHTCTKKGGSWAKRKAAILRTVKSVNPDLLLLQETDDWDGTEDEMAAALAAQGYAFANQERERCLPVECSNQIFYRPEALTPMGNLASGHVGDVRMSEFSAPSLYRGQVHDRPLGYAFFTINATGEPVAVVSMHLTKRYEGQGQLFQNARHARLGEARGLPAWVARKAAELGISNPKVILGGDVNSHPEKEKDGPQSIFAQSGYSNAERARKARNIKFSTVNEAGTPKRFEGFPPKARKFFNPGPKIDVVVTKNFPRAVEYEVVLKLKKKRKFHPKYRGSDHNMVRAVLPL